MNKLKIWNYNNSEVRTTMVNNEPWWVLKDVCTILEIQNHKDIPNRLEPDEVGRFELPHPQSKNKTIEMVCINESGLYSVILRSDKPQAKPFRKWVTSEVLPTIRKTGGYVNDDEMFVQTYLPFADEQTKALFRSTLEVIKNQNAKIEADKPKVLFANAVETADTSILVGDLAKLIKQNGVDIGQKRLFAWLRDKGYLIKSGNSRNMPTQKSMDLKLFEVKERTISNPDGSVRITKTTKVTGKGQQYFINKFLTA